MFIAPEEHFILIKDSINIEFVCEGHDKQLKNVIFYL